jgi:hypothetical protein
MPSNPCCLLLVAAIAVALPGLRSRAGGVRNAKRWPACVRVLAGTSAEVAGKAQEAGMRLALPTPPGAAAAAAAPGPRNGLMALPHQQQEQPHLMFVGLDLKYGQVRELMQRLEMERATAAQQAAVAGGGAEARARKGAGLAQGTGEAARRGGAYD